MLGTLLLGTGMDSDTRPLKVADFGGNKSTFFGRDKGKGRRKHRGKTAMEMEREPELVVAALRR